MALGQNPSIVRNGLIFYYDMNNTRKSWRGKPTTNLILYSEEFDNSANWSYSNCGVTKVNNIIAPDGSRNVYAFYGNSSNTYHTVYQLYSYVSGRTYTQSIYAKAGLFTSCFMQFNPSAFGSWIGATFDLVNGTASDPSGSITNVGNGWYRCSVTATATASSSQPAVYFYSSNSPYVGTNSGTQPEVYIYGAQLEESTFATGYIRTTSAAATRSNTQTILDLTNNRTVTAQEVTYNSNGTFSFNNTANWCEISSLPAQTDSPLSVFAWVYLNATPTGTNGIWGHYGASAVNCHFETYSTYTRIRLGNVNNTSLPVMATGTWVNVGFTSNGTAHKYYVNGVEQASWSGSTGTLFGSFTHMFGRSDVGRTWNGPISALQIYLGQLSANEVAQNFNAHRDRYGI